MRVFAVFLVFSLFGCERFRYECQDPKKWETEQCKRPYCAVTGTCPDQLLKPEEMKGDEK